MRLRPFSRRCVFTLVATTVLLLVASATVPARAQTYTVLHSFGSGTDGATPQGGVSSSNLGGSLVGSTEYGGASGDGTVFYLNHVSGVWDYSVLVSFDGADGSNPYGSPIGPHRYGTTEFGGANHGGAANGGGTLYDFDVSAFEGPVYSFCSLEGCADGAYPVGGVIDSDLCYYGTTTAGGSGFGVVYKWCGSTGEAVVHAFSGTPGDGAAPYGPLVGNVEGTILYGTTNGGGTADEGTVFELDVSTGAVTVLHSFIGSPSGDGSSPIGAVYFYGPTGNLYGTTVRGGSHGYGTVFEISAAGEYSVLYSFTGGADGAGPETPPSLDPSGNLVGVTTSGGLGYGTVYELTPAGDLGVLHTFCSVAGCPDGAAPTGLWGNGGTFFGTATAGGAYGKGVVFELVE